MGVGFQVIEAQEVVDSSRRSICQVGFTWYVGCMNRYGVIEAFEEGMDPVEYIVNGFTFTPVVPPSLNHSLVVAINPKVSTRTNKPGESSDE